MRWARVRLKSNGLANITASGRKKFWVSQPTVRRILKMKSFLMALVALIVISISANLLLQQIGLSSSNASTSFGNVRISD